jgi:peptide chain release factor 2
LPAKQTELDDLDRRSADPKLWEDQSAAQSLLRRAEELRDEIGAWRNLEERARGLAEIAELAEADPAGSASLTPDLERDLAALQQDWTRMEGQLLLSEPHDVSPAIVSVHAGAGGTESQDWAEMLLRMYLRWTEKRGYKRDITDIQAGEEAGIKSATVLVQGEFAYGNLATEVGVHRLVRISPFDSAARRHTSFASVFVWPQIDEDIKIDVQDKDIRVDTYRSSGAGGQHVNVTDSAVRITHLPTGIVVSCQNERSQIRNREVAMKVLKSRLYDLELQKQRAKLDAVESLKKDIAFGSQIRSYVMQPYRMVKDHRTKHEVGDVDRVMDGDLDEFIKATLMAKAKGTLAADAPAEE